MVDAHRNEQLTLVANITKTSSEAEKKRLDERARKINEEKLAQDIVLKAE
jgi:hypothetical protein